MKTRLIISALSLLFALSAPCLVPHSAHADLSKTVTVEKAGGFSYRAPMGWEITDVPGSTFRMVGAPPEQGAKYRPVLKFEVAHAKVGFDFFVTETLKRLEKEQHLTVTGRARFKGGAGMQGYRVVAEGTSAGIPIRFVLYFLSPKQYRQGLVIGATYITEGDLYDDTFDECARSFKLL